MAENKVTITDVARAAGVSISTVSRVMNNSTPVSPDLREQVLKAVQDLGYRPNVLAQNLRNKSVAAIGVIIPDIRAPFFSMVVRGIEDICFHNDHTVLLCNSDDDPEKELLYAEELYRRQVDGIIFVSGLHADTTANHERYHALRSRGVPIVLVNGHNTDIDAPSVRIANENARLNGAPRYGPPTNT